MRWLVLRLRSPLASFGGVVIGSHGVTRDFPAASALTGLLANALGYERHDTNALDKLQSRLVFGCRYGCCDEDDYDHMSDRLTDYQTAKLEKNDKGWTTHGYPEGRDGSDKTYEGSHIRKRDYHADMRMTIVLRLDPLDESPSLDEIAKHLDFPERPVFWGRKSCLPADYLLAPSDDGRWIEAEDAYQALMALPGKGEMLALWPVGSSEGEEIADIRNWRSGFHGGNRRVKIGTIKPS